MGTLLPLKGFMNNMRKINTYTPGNTNSNSQPSKVVRKNVHTADSKQSENASFFARFLASWQKFTTWICNLFSRQVTVTSQSDQLNAANANVKQDSFEKKIQKRIQNIPLVKVNSDSDSPGTILDALARSSKLKGLKQTSNGNSVLKTIQGIHRYLAKKECDAFEGWYRSIDRDGDIDACWNFINEKLEGVDDIVSNIKPPMDAVYPAILEHLGRTRDGGPIHEMTRRAVQACQQFAPNPLLIYGFHCSDLADSLGIPILIADKAPEDGSSQWYTLYLPNQKEIYQKETRFMIDENGSPINVDFRCEKLVNADVLKNALAVAKIGDNKFAALDVSKKDASKV